MLQQSRLEHLFVLLLPFQLPFESLQLLSFREDARWFHSGGQTEGVATHFALALSDVSDATVATVLANEFRIVTFLVSSPEELSASEANDASVVADVNLAGLGLARAHEARGQVVFIIRVERQVIFHRELFPQFNGQFRNQIFL
jgi:hypothetical protein